MDDDYDSSNKSVAEIGLERWTAQSEIDYMNHHGIDAVRYA